MVAAPFSPRTLLVTGGAGFIGSNFIPFALREHPDLRIVNLDLLTYAGDRDNLAGLAEEGRHTLVEGDICDGALVDRLFRDHEIDAVVHFAAESHVDRSIDGPAAFIQTNIVGTFTLLEAARAYWSERRKLDHSICRFHHVSTDEVYGSLSATAPPFSETASYAPNSPYSAAKAGSDHLARAYFHTYGLPVVTTNCSNNYGPRQNVEKFIPTILRSCLLEERIQVYGDGSNIRDWLYVEDHCRGIDAALRRGRAGETYNLGGDCEMANIEVATTICRRMDELHPRGAPHERLIQFVPDRPGHDWRYAIDFSKAREELGWSPRETFATGLAKTVDWYLGNDKWRSLVSEGTHSGQRLGLKVSSQGIK